MAITELATIFLQPPTTSDSTPLLTVLQKAKSVQEKASGYPVYYFKDSSNLNTIYIIGTWESQEKHMAFLPHKENQEVLGLLMPLCVEENSFTLMHIDMELKGEGGAGFIDWQEIGVVRFDLASRCKSDLEEWVGKLGGCGPLGKCGGFGGWSVEKENEGEERFIAVMKMMNVGEFLNRSLEEMPPRVPDFPAKNGGTSSSMMKYSSFKAQRLLGL